MSKAKAALAPMPAFIEPCLASLATLPPAGTQWAHEIKFDGYRLQARIEAGRIQLLTRSGLDWTNRFAGLAKPLSTLAVSAAIIDGEVVVEAENGTTSFVELVADLKIGRSDRMVFYAFDLLFRDGVDLRQFPLVDRKAALKRLLPRRRKDAALRYSDHVQGHGDAMLKEACQLGLEGIISKRLDLPHRSGRGNIWLKSKCITNDEFVIVGYLPAKTVKDAVGALVVGFYDGAKLIYAGRVGTGFSRRVAAELWQSFQPLRSKTSALSKAVDTEQAKDVVWIKPRLVAQIEYRGWTGDGLLRHAAFKSLRDDKTAKSVIDPRKALT